MDATPSALLNFYIFSTGRRVFAMRQVTLAAAAAGFGDLAAHAELTVAHDLGVRALEARWIGQSPETLHSPEARQLDIIVDTTLFVREAQVAGRIGASPHITDVLDAGVDPERGTPFLVMELLEGEPLGAHLSAHGRSSPRWRCACWSSSPRRWIRRTRRASSTGTSSRPTSS